ncbi:hypothetical protein FJU30_26210 [Affinibrenneria salicis]|uniref:Uncharacterized protein n=1 Tax=Affinibrenneria salicis TaxID=2590031 RepID=A0A5J5FPU6_9GAMM|nr:hypothetical protein [Affinibrenneria salicis]KAA8994546.1 hypothetical protein FJU30_26210 [Affinibrenneria salicis]
MPESDRIELPGSDPDSLTALLIRAAGHPTRPGRFEVTKDLPEMNEYQPESFIADVGRAFLSALAGLHLAGEPMWNGELGSDPWLLLKSVSDAGKAVGWLEAQRQASCEIQLWQQYAGHLMAEHYGHRSLKVNGIF